MNKKLNYIGHNQWDGLKFPEFYNNVINNDYDKIILFCQNEWEWHMHNPEYWPKLQEHCKKIGKPIHVITGAAEQLYPLQVENTVVDWWVTNWTCKTYCDLMNSPDALQINPKAKVNYKHHFISMNHNAHVHRCFLIDLLAKYNLMENNPVSVHKNSPIYNWKYYNFQIRYVEPEFAHDKNYSRIPKPYYDSFAQLVSESSGNTLFLSEKTATPLLIGKPFLVATQMHFHKMLKDLGFLLYDEIFDYSFDDEPDQEKRYEMLLENYRNLVKIPISQLPDLHKKISGKIAFNQSRVKHLVYDLNYYPKIAIEVIDYYKETGIAIDSRLIDQHMLLEQFSGMQFKKIFD